MRHRTFSILDKVRPRSQTVYRKSYLHIKHHFSVHLSVFTLYNKEIKYTINVSCYYLHGGVSTTLRNGVLFRLDLSRHSSSLTQVHKGEGERLRANFASKILVFTVE